MCPIIPLDGTNRHTMCRTTAARGLGANVVADREAEGAQGHNDQQAVGAAGTQLCQPLSGEVMPLATPLQCCSKGVTL